MRALLALAIVMGSGFGAIASDTGPVFVVPGRAGVPVVINGRDASYAVVEGDWGLAKNVHVQPTIFGGSYIDQGPAVGHYYPSSGRVPGYGRYEIQPSANRSLPIPAESYQRSWSSRSDVPPNPPPVIPASPYNDFQNGGAPNGGPNYSGSYQNGAQNSVQNGQSQDFQRSRDYRDFRNHTNRNKNRSNRRT